MFDLCCLSHLVGKGWLLLLLNVESIDVFSFTYIIANIFDMFDRGFEHASSCIFSVYKWCLLCILVNYEYSAYVVLTYSFGFILVYAWYFGFPLFLIFFGSAINIDNDNLLIEWQDKEWPIVYNIGYSWEEFHVLKSVLNVTFKECFWVSATEHFKMSLLSVIFSVFLWKFLVHIDSSCLIRFSNHFKQ